MLKEIENTYFIASNQKAIRNRLELPAQDDLTVLESAGAVVDLVSTLESFSKIYYRLTFPHARGRAKPLIVLEQNISLTTEPLILKPEFWAVLEDKTAWDLALHRLRFARTPFHLQSLREAGFKVDEFKILDRDETKFWIQFPDFKVSRFQPNLILTANASGFPDGWEIVKQPTEV